MLPLPRRLPPLAPRALPLSLALSLAVALAPPAVAVAQADVARPTAHAPLLLRIPTGTRALALGGAAVAIADAEAVFHNPAQLAGGRGVAVGAHRYGAGATQRSVAVALPFAPGGLGVGVQQLSWDAPCGGCADAVPVREGALARRGDVPSGALAATLAFGADLSGVNVGVAGRWVEQRVGVARADALALDVGVARRVGPAWVAVAARNLGGRLAMPTVGSWQLPRHAAAGAAIELVPVGPLDLSASTEVAVFDGGEVTAGGGVEVGYAPLQGYAFALRAGARDVPGGGLSPLTLGATATRDRLTVEYAHQAIDGGAGAVHRVGLRLRP